MKLSQFNYDLPKELIAKYPADDRDKARMMVVNRKSGKIEHKLVGDLINYFSADDVVVLNNTKVIPARLSGTKEKTNANIEVFLLRELNAEEKLWDVLVDPARKIRIGNKLYFGEGELVAEVVDNTTSRGRTLRFLFDGSHDEFKEWLYKLGRTPLPRHVGRGPEEIDVERYQTVFATEEGAVAAPTAGLHISKQMLKRFEIKGVQTAFITLHVGLGNFQRIEVEDLSKHKADAEQIIIPPETESMVNTALDAGKRVCAVGTTVVRAMESSVTSDAHVRACDKWTNMFIFPPYEVQIPNAMLTNFHLPKSSMMMTVASFSGAKVLKAAYEVAVKERYGFGTYGDAMLII